MYPKNLRLGSKYGHSLDSVDPEASVVPTLIRDNFQARLALKVADLNASTIILGCSGAETITGKGEAIYRDGRRRNESKLRCARSLDRFRHRNKLFFVLSQSLLRHPNHLGLVAEFPSTPNRLSEATKSSSVFCSKTAPFISLRSPARSAAFLLTTIPQFLNSLSQNSSSVISSSSLEISAITKALISGS